MTDADIYTRLTAIFRRVLGDESIVLTSSSSADDIEAWDSLNHIFLLVEIEKSFGMKFQAAEMEVLKNVGQLAALLQKRASIRSA
jgi:acyl carrier protein